MQALVSLFPYCLRSSAALWIGLAAAVTHPVAAHADTITISWDANDPDDMVIGYKVYYDSDMSGPPYDGTEANEGPSPIDISLESLQDPDAPSIDLTGLPSCVRFYITLTAYTESAESTPSGEAEKMVLAEPTALVALSEEPGEVSLSWAGLPDDDQGSIAGFRVHWDTDAGEPYDGASSPMQVTELFADLTGLEEGVVHYFMVESFCNGGHLEPSEEVSATPMLSPEIDTDTDTDPLPTDDGGCSCESATAAGAAGWWGFPILMAVLAAGVRRRR